MSMVQIVPYVLITLVFYFLIIKPAQDERAAKDKLLAALQKDDRVVTAGGLHGRVVSVDGDTLQVEVAKGVVVTLDKSSVVSKVAQV